MHKYIIWGIIIVFSIIILDTLIFCFTTCSMAEIIIHPHYYNAEVFPVRAYMNITPEYKKQVNAGTAVAGTKTIVICALARNVMKSLFLNQRRLENWGNKFRDYRIIIYENDSTDGTREALLKWQLANPKVYILPCGLSDDPENDCKYNEKPLYDLGFNSFGRFSKMAAMRNQYLNYVKSNYAHFDYMMVYDIDINGPMNDDGMMIPFASAYQWDAICANGIAPIPGLCGMFYSHYDTLALVELNEPYNQTKHLSMFGMAPTYLKTCVNTDLNFDRPLYPVKSAFGGATIYKMSSILSPKIQYGTEYGCEHTYFHKNMADHGFGRIFINPAGIILVGRQGPDLWTGFTK